MNARSLAFAAFAAFALLAAASSWLAGRILAPPAAGDVGPRAAEPAYSAAAPPAAPASPAQSPPAPPPLRTELDAIAAYGGRVNAAVAAGGALYLAQGQRIETADLAEPTRPRFAGTLPFSRTVSALALANGRLVAAAGERLVVLDLADPLRPAVLGEHALPDRGLHLAVDDARGLVYAAWGAPFADLAGIDVVSLADPATPRLASRIESPAEPDDLAAGDGALYVASWRGVDVYDTRDVAAPVLVPQFEPDLPRADILRIARIGAVLYAVHHLRGRGVTMTSAIELVTPLTLHYRGGSGTNAYEPRHLLVHDGWLLTTRLSLDRLTSDLSVLGGASGRYDLGWEGRANLYGQVTALAATGDHLYAATDGCGITVLAWQPADFAATDVAELPVAGTVALAGPIEAVERMGDVALVLGARGDSCNRLDRVDLTDPAAPVLRALVPLPSRPIEAVAAGDGAVVALEGGGRPELRRWSGATGAPLSPPVPDCGAPWWLARDAATGDVVAVGSPSQGSDQAVAMRLAPGAAACGEPVDVGSVEAMVAAAADAGRLALLGYAAPDTDWTQGALRLFPPGARAPAGSVAHPLEGDQPYAMAFLGRAVYVVGGGLRVYDAADPSAPRPMHDAVREPSYGAAAIDVQGAQVAIAESDVALYDAADPLHPRAVARWDVAGAEDVALLGTHLLVAAGDAGLYVLPILPPGWRAVDTAFLPSATAGR